MESANAFSPGHVTGFFSIEDKNPNPLAKGSLGAGFCLKTGVHSRITRMPSFSDIVVFMNRQFREDAVTTRSAIDLFFRKSGLAREHGLLVEHRLEIPEGSGFGSSAAGALGAVFCLNTIYQRPFTRTECCQLAHEAEIECRTGLGTVAGMSAGGIEIRIKEGAPGIGETDDISIPPNQCAAFLVFGPYSTAKALSDPLVRENINSVGPETLEELLRAKTLANLQALSRSFVERTGLVTESVRPVLAALKEMNLPGSMLLFGDGVFSIVPCEALGEVVRIFRAHGAKADCFVTEIDAQGTRELYGH